MVEGHGKCRPRKEIPMKKANFTLPRKKGSLFLLLLLTLSLL